MGCFASLLDVGYIHMRFHPSCRGWVGKGGAGISTHVDLDARQQINTFDAPIFFVRRDHCQVDLAFVRVTVLVVPWSGCWLDIMVEHWLNVCATWNGSLMDFPRVTLRPVPLSSRALEHVAANQV